MIKRSLKKLLLVSSLWLPIGFYGLLSSKLSSQLESTTSPKITTFWDVRVKKVEEFCETHHKKATTIGKAKAIHNLLVLKERNLVWCPVYKAGTSAWMTYLVHLSKKSSTEKEKLIAKHPSSLGNVIEFHIFLWCRLLIFSRTGSTCGSKNVDFKLEYVVNST